MRLEWRVNDHTRAMGFVVLQFLALLPLMLATLPSLFHFHALDLTIYYQSSLGLLQGQWPYRDFPLAYPPLALLPFALPHLIVLGWPLSLAGYVRILAVQNVLFSTMMTLAFMQIAPRWQPPRPAAPVLYLYTILAIVSAPLLLWKFDAFPALLTLLALLALLAGRPTLAGVCLGCGIAAKLYPVVLLPVLVAYYLAGQEYRAPLRLLVGSAIIIGLVLLPFILTGPGAMLSSLGYQQARGLEIGSLPAGVLSLTRLLGLTDAEPILHYGTWDMVSPLADIALKWQPVVFVLAFGVVYASCLGRFRDEWKMGGAVTTESLVAYVVAALLTFMATNKVLSPQYIIWLLPFGPLLRSRQAYMLLAIFVLTIVVFPFTFDALTTLSIFPVLVLNLRNMLVVALILGLLVEYRPRLNVKRLT